MPSRRRAREARRAEPRAAPVLPPEQEQLIAPRHIPRQLKIGDEWLPNPDQRLCPMRDLGCLECAAEDADQAALNRKLFSAQAAIRDIRKHDAQRRGEPIPKRQRHKRPDIGKAAHE